MALSTRPPPPPDPPSTSTATPIPRPILPNPRPSPPPNHTLPHPHPHPLPHLYQHHPTLPSSRLLSNFPHQQFNNNNHNNDILYPLASSGRGRGRGRGFLPKQPSVTISNSNPSINSNMYAARPGLVYQRPQFSYDRAHSDLGLVQSGQAGQLGQGFGFIRPQPYLQHALVASSSGAGGVMPAGVVKGVPVSKMGLSQTAIPDSNGYKDVRDRIRDDSFVIIKDRKVRISENASLYALCRSWLRNGFSEETQPHYIDVAKSLPRPLPLAAEDSQSLVKKEDDKKEEDEGSVENLTPQELLQRHVKRAKRVRSRLREERLRRIARYKTRLGLLLPPMAEQHFRKDSAAGNGNGNGNGNTS